MLESVFFGKIVSEVQSESYHERGRFVDIGMIYQGDNKDKVEDLYDQVLNLYLDIYYAENGNNLDSYLAEIKRKQEGIRNLFQEIQALDKKGHFDKFFNAEHNDFYKQDIAKKFAKDIEVYKQYDAVLKNRTITYKDLKAMDLGADIKEKSIIRIRTTNHNITKEVILDGACKSSASSTLHKLEARASYITGFNVERAYPNLKERLYQAYHNYYSGNDAFWSMVKSALESKGYQRPRI